MVGHGIGGDVIQRATLWTEGRIVDLGTLGNESGAMDINARGQSRRGALGRLLGRTRGF